MDKSMLRKADVARRRVRRPGADRGLDTAAAIRTGFELRAAARSAVATSAAKLQVKPAAVMAKAAAARKQLHRG
jgi:hypothetical protein